MLEVTVDGSLIMDGTIVITNKYAERVTIERYSRREAIEQMQTRQEVGNHNYSKVSNNDIKS
tara:strand:+ start:154 stop:339 length:186 start_codon:yes stop_codon:yes gene_type:complete